MQLMKNSLFRRALMGSNYTTGRRPSFPAQSQPMCILPIDRILVHDITLAIYVRLVISFNGTQTRPHENFNGAAGAGPGGTPRPTMAKTQGTQSIKVGSLPRLPAAHSPGLNTNNTE